MKLAYLGNIFRKLNELNLQLQDRDKHLSQLADKISAFTRKLEMYSKQLEEGNADCFENLCVFAEASWIGSSTVISCLKEHSTSQTTVLSITG